MYSLRQFTSIIIGAAACSVVLEGCIDKCVGVNCAPCNGLLDNIVVVFDRDSLQGGFRKAEMEGAYAVRYAAPGFTTPFDTIRQMRGGVDFHHGVSLRVLPWPTVPAVQGPYELKNYSYRFVLPAANRTYDLSGIELQTGEGTGGDCCDCGVNTRRRFTLNGAPVVADGAAYDQHAAIFRR
ncbi:hypothetical protein [Hymenobacter negativus]|uniref:DUF4249 family protein n=1 Tax=Hymenobacter negativus TaxID=2795026 RepID=A0ABS3Q9M4_9BACT|nr:hypothetical protein [Hymenobacter negativus]MBO2007939.1 hypothetical protein [Hymenobacter negativus]